MHAQSFDYGIGRHGGWIWRWEKALLRFALGVVFRRQTGWVVGAGSRGIGWICRSNLSAVVAGSFAGEFLPAFLLLLVFLRQISLTLFELVIWFSQGVAF